MFSNAVPIDFYAWNRPGATQYSAKGKFFVSFWEWDVYFNSRHTDDTD